jgi:HEAT repeat protein
VQEARSALILLLLAFHVPGATAQQATPSAPLAEELIRQEQLRSAVEQALALYNSPTESGVAENENFVRAVDDLVRIGPEIVPILAAELEQALPTTYFFCAYALGRLGGPEAEAALRAAVARANEEPGDFALTRKGWAVYGLGLMGVGDAIELIYRGRHRTGLLPIHGGMTVLEAVALQTQPDSTPILLKLIDQLAGVEKSRAERTKVLRALWRLADPAAVPKLKEVMREDDRHMRQEAVRALACIRTPEALEATLAALSEDPEHLVRRLAAASLEQAQAEVPAEVVLARLEVEEHPRVRSALFVLLVQRLGLPAIRWMQDHWEEASASDRLSMLFALEELPVADTLPLLEQGLRDSDNQVVIRAVLALGALGNQEAVKRLRLAVHSPSWAVARAAVEQLVKLRATDAGETVANRLLDVELYRVVRQVDQRYRPEILADAVAALEYTKALDGLKRATAKQVDPVLIESLQRNIAQLEAMKANRDELQSWIEAVRSPQREIRVLAYHRLARLGGEEATKALVGAFGRVDTDEGVEILEAAGELDEAPVLELLHRVLTGPEFDAVERWPLRDMAAWSARRIGGERMARSLREAVERREGRDAAILVYYLALERERARPTLERYRLSRMQYLKWTRGKEFEALDRIARRIEAGRTLPEFDVPPQDMDFR